MTDTDADTVELPVAPAETLLPTEDDLPQPTTPAWEPDYAGWQGTPSSPSYDPDTGRTSWGPVDPQPAAPYRPVSPTYEPLPAARVRSRSPSPVAPRKRSPPVIDLTDEDADLRAATQRVIRTTDPRAKQEAAVAFLEALARRIAPQ